MSACKTAVRKILAAALAACVVLPGPVFASGVQSARSATVPILGAGRIVVAPPLSLDPLDFNIKSAALSSSVQSLSVGTIPADIPTPARNPLPALKPSAILDILGDLQRAGVPLDAGVTRMDAYQLEAAAQALPAGHKARETLMLMAAGLKAGGAGGSQAYLSGAYDGSGKGAGGHDAVAAVTPSQPAALRLRSAGRKMALDPKVVELSPTQGRWTPAIEQLPESTRQVNLDDRQIVGQDAALKAMRFGLQMPGDNYHLYVSGPPGSGRETALRHILEELAPKQKTPPDLIAVTNFSDKNRPLLLRLAPGGGKAFAEGVGVFIEEYSARLPDALSSPQMNSLRMARDKALREAQAKLTKIIDEAAAKVRLPSGEGKFGLKITFTQDEDGALQPRAFPTYKDPQDGQYKTVKSDEELEALVRNGVFTEAEFEKATQEAGVAAQELQPLLQKMMQTLASVAASADQQIKMAEIKTAAGLAQAVGQKALLGLILPNTHDTPEHKAWSQSVQERAAALEAEIRKAMTAVRLPGGYGVALGASLDILGGEGLPVVITKQKDGEWAPLDPKELQEKLESGEIDQKAVVKALKPFIARFNELKETVAKEHKALHEKDPPLTADQKRAAQYVSALMTHAAVNFKAFLPGAAISAGEGGPRIKLDPSEFYRVSVLADNSKTQGAPVVFVRKPTLKNLFGKAKSNDKKILTSGGPVEVDSPGGPSFEGEGAVFKAAGGYLVVDVMDLLQQPGAYQALMQFIKTGQAEIVEGGMMSFLRGDSYTLPAEAAEPGDRLKTKVVFIGSALIQHLLKEYDNDFSRHFNATAAFESSLPINAESISGYLQFMKKVIAKAAQQGEEILDFARDGIGGLLEEAARMIDSNQELTAQFGKLYGLMKEASFFAAQAGRAEVKREDVDAALKQRRQAQEVELKRMRELYEKYIFVVETEGEKYAQINGTAVLGGHGGSGAVMRKTATVAAPGQGRPSGVFSTDSKAGMTGPSYLKGLSNIDGMLNEIFGRIEDLLPHIQISSEQNYGGIDGDSATSTQFYLVLAALANLRIRQYYAVTGSADQHGMVQAIGGINEKTKGFFDLAKRRGLTGRQGMIFPRANMGDLMLDPEIVQAMAEGKFHMYAIDHVSQGVEILTGVPYQTVIRRALIRARELRASNWLSRLYWRVIRRIVVGRIVNPAAQTVAPWQPQPTVLGTSNGQEGPSR